MGREEVPVSSQRLQGYDLYKDGNGDEVTKAKGKKEHGFSSGNCTPTVLLEIVRVLGVIRDEHTVKTTHSNQSNKALESLAKEFTFYTERTLGVFRG